MMQIQVMEDHEPAVKGAVIEVPEGIARALRRNVHDKPAPASDVYVVVRLDRLRHGVYVFGDEEAAIAFAALYPDTVLFDEPILDMGFVQEAHAAGEQIVARGVRRTLDALVRLAGAHDGDFFTSIQIAKESGLGDDVTRFSLAELARMTPRRVESSIRPGQSNAYRLSECAPEKQNPTQQQGG